ncbi:hypothetical protein [Methylobacterium aquaticum]|uniref:hypothetical protein n=1 Tax=Methylobacterium aquaticum TaxID=270351 RepID=UPI00193387A4|nr:hypothetical protein [Methylobacterium aquaticum]QRE74443.1 hypothetical protein F1D61_13255 [Methylobacterium aquaticum]
MMVATLADTATELLLTGEYDLAGVVLVDVEQDQVTPLLRATTELSVELQQVIVALAAAGIHRAQRVLSAYVAVRCILEDPPPRAKMKSMARVLSRLIRFEEVAAREPDLDRVLAQARGTARGVKARKLAIDWSLSKPIAR